MEGPDVALMLPFLRQRRDRFAVFPDAQQTFEQIVEYIELHIALGQVRIQRRRFIPVGAHQFLYRRQFSARRYVGRLSCRRVKTQPISCH